MGVESMVDIQHEIKIQATPERVFQALARVEDLRAWHSAQVQGSGGVGGVLTFEHTGGPTFHWEVAESVPQKRVAWKCTAGPGDSVGTTVSFDLAPTADGRTLVELAHKGWPGTHGNYRKCNTYWGVLLHHLKQYLETGACRPAFA
jgi:uncharacterized protein YndB with AHSA1/START domain